MASKNKCDECNAILNKEQILAEFGVPLVVWVCPNSEFYQYYRRQFRKKYYCTITSLQGHKKKDLKNDTYEFFKSDVRVQQAQKV